jgi:hypothetical protein
VTIGAEELEVFEPVVQPIAIDVVQLHADGFPVPFRDPTPLTPVLLEPLSQEAVFQVGAFGFPPGNQQLQFTRHRVRARDDVASTHCVSPRVPAEPKPVEACFIDKPSSSIALWTANQS